MRLFGLLVAVLLVFATPANAAPAIDGIAPFQACGSGNPLTISTTLTTTQTHDAIVVRITWGNTPGWGYSVTSSSGLQFTRRAQVQATGITTDKWEEWYAPAASVLTGETITFTSTTAGGSNCIKMMAFGISGAQWPDPFDPLYNFPFTSNSPGGTSNFSTKGTDDLVVAGYGQNGCFSPTPGAGWTGLYAVSGSDMVEYANFASAQTNTTAALGSCAGNVQTVIIDAFVAADGLLAIEESSKLNTYAVLQTGMGTSKQNMYVIAEPAIGTSKLNGYVILQGQINVINPKTGLTIFHAFPP